jgi:hypothetical protein
MATWSGWLAVMLVVLAATMPLAHRIVARRRAAPDSTTTRVHAAIGSLAAAGAFAHTVVVLPSLGSPAAVGGGMAALLPGGAAFFLLVAHAGIGLQLRDPRLKKRVAKRRTHIATALAISAAVATHVLVLERLAR